METMLLTKDELAQAKDIILAGELVAFPTETVYGLGADATNPEAVAKVYAAKGRPSDNPLIVHLSDINELAPFVEEIPEVAIKLAQQFWPGPLTMIFKIIPGSLPSVVTGGLATAAFRIPNHQLTLDLIKLAGVPLVGPSANTSGKPSPTTAQHVLHDLTGKIAGVLDGGSTTVGIESTVLDLSVDQPVILRPGKIVETDLLPIIPHLIQTTSQVSQEEQPKAPGMKYQHYSPEASVLMMPIDTDDWQAAINHLVESGKRVGILASENVLNKHREKDCVSFELTVNNTVEEASRNLFAGLRSLDEMQPKVDVILVQTYQGTGLGKAYMNRLQKSADNRYFSEQ